MTSKRHPVSTVFFWLVAAALATALALVLVFFAVNWRDRAPSAAARRLDQVTQALPVVTPAQNAFIYLLGMDSPHQQDPAKVGSVRFNWLVQQSRVAAAPAASFPDRIAPYVVERAPAYLALYASCRQIDGNCADALEKDPVQAVAWVNSEQWILDRYLALIGHPAWSEVRPLDPGMPAVPYTVALDSQRLFFVHVWINASKGDVAAVNDLLGKDLVFWRRVLAASDSVHARMAAAVAIGRHFVWSSLVFRTLPPDQRLDAIPSAWRSPMTAAERSILRNAAAEYEASKRSLVMLRERHRASLLSPLAPLSDRLIHVQHTANRHADALAAVADAFALDYPRLPKAGQALPTPQPVAQDVVDSWLYNLVGKAAPAPDLTMLQTSARRSADLEGLRRAALVTALLRAEPVAPEAMQARLDASELRDPGTGKPFKWDAEAQGVRFVGISPKPQDRYTVYY